MNQFTNYPYQNIQPQYQQIDQPSNTNCNFIYVNGYNQVQEYVVRPNQRLYFLDNNDNYMYVKEANNFGIATTETYEIKKVENVPVVQPIQNPPQDIITREEFESLQKQLNDLQTKLNNQSNKGDNRHESIKTNNKQSNGRANENFERRN